MSLITVLHPVPDVSGVVSNICTFSDENWHAGEGTTCDVEKDESLDLDYLVSVLRDLLKV